MATIKSRGAFAQRLGKALEAVEHVNTPRDYIGASVLGTKCDRALFYVKERVVVPAFIHRVNRIFQFGHEIEILAVKWLRETGVYVYDIDPRTKDQFLIVGPDHDYQGHGDGIISSVPLTPVLFNARHISGRISEHAKVLEIKSHKDNRFLDVVDMGVEHAHFEHYAQMQTYMGDSWQMLEAFGIDDQLDSALYMAINKNTSEVYFEEVPYDHACYLRLSSRARRIKSAVAPPPRLAVSADKQPCKYCDYKIHCFADPRQEEALVGTLDASGSGTPGATKAPDASGVRNPKWGFSDVSRRNATESRGSASWRN